MDLNVDLCHVGRKTFRTLKKLTQAAAFLCDSSESSTPAEVPASKRRRERAPPLTGRRPPHPGDGHRKHVSHPSPPTPSLLMQPRGPLLSPAPQHTQPSRSGIKCLMREAALAWLVAWARGMSHRPYVDVLCRAFAGSHLKSFSGCLLSGSFYRAIVLHGFSRCGVTIAVTTTWGL